MNFNDFKNSNNLLTQEQMKNVKGGLCQVLTNSGPIWVQYSQLEEALDSGYVSRWCCASCTSASWSIKD